MDVSWHAQPVDAVLTSLKTTAYGLSSDETSRRLAEHGPNRLPPPPRASALHILLDQFRG